MRLDYNTIQLPGSQVKVARWDYENVRSPLGRRVQRKVRVLIEGYLKGSSQSALTTAIDAFEVGLVDGYDLEWLDNSLTATSHTITSANTVNGVRVIGPQWTGDYKGLAGSGMEYVNRRSFRVIFEAELDNDESSSGLVAYSEVFRVLQNGGPDFVIQEGLIALPQRQETKQATKFVAEQVGSAVGLTSHPNFPSKLMSQSDLKPRPFLEEYGDAQKKGVNGNRYFPARWHYRYESADASSVIAPSEPTV